MSKPVLVVMAAGMGSRYGGLKQIQPVGPNGQALMDYALYDALKAGFEEAVFVISPVMEADFPQDIRSRVGERIKTRCVVQDLQDVPQGMMPPQGRTKPWGTGHAVRACRSMIDEPFAVINADDYYGPSALTAIYGFLEAVRPATPSQYAMVGYALKNTLSDSGAVARGICSVDEDGNLLEIHERTHVISTTDGALFTEDGQIYHKLPDHAIASMNLWGFTADVLRELDTRFDAFLSRAVNENPQKAEYLLPELVGDMQREGKAAVKVLPCAERWYGVTYAQDLPGVVEAIDRLTEEGVYPRLLWE